MKYTIKSAAEKLGLSEVYVRRAIQTGKLATEKTQISENVWRHEIDEEVLNAWRNNAGTRTIRNDGRNKFVAYYTPEEFAKIQEAAGNLGIIERANKPEDIKRRQANKLAKRSKTSTPAVATVEAPVAKAVKTKA